MSTEFLTKNDYEAQIRSEMLDRILDETGDGEAVRIAQKMAVDQIREYIGGRYDCDAIFAARGEARNYFIVMIAVDITLYHLWSKRAPGKMPEHRQARYQDAIDWLTGVGKGTIAASLPQPAADNYNAEVIIKSRYKQSENRY